MQSGKITSFSRKIKEKSGKNVRQNVYKPCLDLYYASLLKRNNCKLYQSICFFSQKSAIFVLRNSTYIYAAGPGGYQGYIVHDNSDI